MTESDIWRKISRWLDGYSVRIENLLTAGFSDVLWCPLGLSVFLELKVRSGNTITVRNSQIVFGINASKSVPSYQHLFLVGSLAFPYFVLYTYATVAACPSVPAEQGKQRYTINNAVPYTIWNKAQDVCDYVKFLEETKRNGTVSRSSSQGK